MALGAYECFKGRLQKMEPEAFASGPEETSEQGSPVGNPPGMVKPWYPSIDNQQFVGNLGRDGADNRGFGGSPQIFYNSIWNSPQKRAVIHAH